MKILSSIILLITAPIFAISNKIRSCTVEKTIALTFDDGPFKYTEELINLLNNNNIQATFFINVENYWKDLPSNKDKQKVLKKAHDSGHQIASHTWAHRISSDINEFNAMMNKTDSWIENVIGYRPAYFRAPKGECYEECMEYLERKDYKLIQWDTDTNDWDITSGKSYRVKKAKEFLSESFEYKRSNYLILMHDVYEHTVREIVPWIISNKPEGYKFVTVAECLGDKSSMYRSRSASKVTQTESQIEKTTTTTKVTPTTAELEQNNSNSSINNNTEKIDNENNNNNSGFNNNDLDNFRNNTEINDDNVGHLVYENAAELSYKFNYIVITFITIIYIKYIM